MPLQRIISNTLKDDAVTQSKIVDNTVNISKLDVTDGTAGQVLSTDGNGVLSFIDAGSGSGSGSESGSESGSGSGSGSGNGNVSTGPSTWRQKGSDLNLQGLGEPNMCRLSDTRIAFCDRTTRELKTIEFDGTNWAVVGNQRVINNPNPIGIPVLCRLTSSTGSGSPDTIAFFDHATQDLRTYSFNGSFWEQIGDFLNLPGTGSSQITRLSDTQIAMASAGTNNLRTFEFGGTGWTQVGSSFSLTNGGQFTLSEPGLTYLATTRDVNDGWTAAVAFCDDNRDLQVYDWRNSTGSWAPTGVAFNTEGDGPFQPAMATLSGLRIAFVDGTNDELRTYDFDGTNWTQVGNGLSIPEVTISCIAGLTENTIAFYNLGTNTNQKQLRTYEFYDPNVVEPFGPSQFGYTMGGSVTGEQHFSSRVDKFAYSSGANATLVADMTATRGKTAAGGCTSSTAAYQCCGYIRDINDNNQGDGGTLKNSEALTKVTFSSDTLSFEFANLSKTQRSIAGVSSSTHGYVGGGFQDSSGSVRKFSFANEQSTSVPHNMTKGRSAFFGVQSGTHGYWGGGSNAVGFAPQNDPNFEKFAFASDGSSASVAALSPNQGSGTCLSSEFQGWIRTGGGTLGAILFELTFASDSNSVNTLGNPPEEIFGGASKTGSYFTAGEGWSHGGVTAAGLPIAASNKFSILSGNEASQQGDLTIARTSSTAHGF